MAAFVYTALDPKGKEVKGVLEADSIRQIRQQLRDQGLVPLGVDPATEKRAATSGLSLSFGRRLGALDLVLFTRQIATLVAAGLPLEEALSAVAQQAEKSTVRTLVMAVRSKVLEGHSLAQALGEFPSSFNDMYRSTVAAGEHSGNLDLVMNNLADYTERRFESRRNVELALFYPVTLLALAVLVVGGLMVYVVPDMVRVFENTQQDMPPITEFLLGASNFMRAWWWAVFLGVGALVLIVRWLLAQPALRLAWDRRKFSIPLIKRIVRSNNAARYASTLSILTSSGVPLVDAMNIAGEVVSNQYLKKRLTEATQRVSEGSSLRVALEGVGQFPPMLLHMVASGEASGELDQMLQRVADYQQNEVQRIVDTIVGLFEPAMLVMMGAVVMFIVMAILLPILNMNQLV